MDDGRACHQTPQLRYSGRPVLYVRLHDSIGECPAADKTLSIVEDRVGRIHCDEYNLAISPTLRSLPVNATHGLVVLLLFVRDYLDSVILPDACARIKGVEIDSYRCSF